MNPTLLNATSALLGVAIEIILRDQFYRDIITRMQAEGRADPTPEELQAARDRVSAAAAGLDAAIERAEQAGR